MTLNARPCQKKNLHDTADNHLLPTLSLLNSGSLRMGVKFFCFVDFVFKEENINFPSLSLFVFLTGLRSLLLFTGGAWLRPLSLSPDFQSLIELSQRHLL